MLGLTPGKWIEGRFPEDDGGKLFVERWAHERHDLLSGLPLILWWFRIMVVWSCWFFWTFVVLDVISALQSRGWKVHLLYSMYSRIICDAFRSMVEATKKWFWPDSDCDKNQSQCKYNIVVLSSLFYFLITIDGILIRQICCIFVYIPYMYLCFTHRKDKSFHHEPVFFPLGLCTAPMTVMSLRYATLSIFLCCKRKMGNCGNRLWNQTSF